MRMLCRQFARSGEIIESVSNDDGDGNKNGKKRSRLRLAFSYISLPSVHDYDVKLPIFTFY